MIQGVGTLSDGHPDLRIQSRDRGLAPTLDDGNSTARTRRRASAAAVQVDPRRSAHWLLLRSKPLRMKRLECLGAAPIKRTKRINEPRLVVTGHRHRSVQGVDESSNCPDTDIDIGLGLAASLPLASGHS